MGKRETVPERKRRKRKEKPPPPNLPDDESIHWSHAAIKEQQERDPVLSIVLQWLIAKEKPAFDIITKERKTLKYWWARYSSLKLTPQGLLTYTWTNKDDSLQDKIILPTSLQRLYLKE